MYNKKVLFVKVAKAASFNALKAYPIYVSVLYNIPKDASIYVNAKESYSTKLLMVHHREVQ